MKTALVIGATGLVGNELVQLLLKDDRFGKIIVFVRRSMEINNSKLEEYIINFDDPVSWKNLVKGDVLFSALGTTLKQAGGKDAQYKVDYTYQFEFAQTASENGVPVYVLVSSSGASPDSKIFYSRMKGELEEAVKKLSFTSINLIQPSLLVGHREKERIGEKIGFAILNAINKIGILKKYRPIHGQVVAQALIQAGLEAKSGIHIYALDRLFLLADK